MDTTTQYRSMNTYTQFCFQVDNLTSEEAEWLKEQLAGDWTFDAHVEIYAEASALTLESSEGDPDEVATFVQQYLQAFRPDGVIAFEWAYSASHLVPGAFGGGAAVITANKTRWLSTSDWAAETAEQMRPSDEKETIHVPAA